MMKVEWLRKNVKTVVFFLANKSQLCYGHHDEGRSAYLCNGQAIVSPLLESLCAKCLRICQKRLRGADVSYDVDYQ